MKRIQAAAGAAALATLAAACSKEDVGANPRDTAWVARSVRSCPAVAAIAKAGWSDGVFSIADLERFQGALVVARDSPVKGQDCDPRFATPTTTRDVVVQDEPVTTIVPVPDGRGGMTVMPQLQPRSHTILADE